jgi:hypothetical protein
MSKDPPKEHKSLSELKNLSHKFDFDFKVGAINSETPLNKFLKNVCEESFESLIYHKELFVEEDSKECSIILLKEKLIKCSDINSTDSGKDKNNGPFILELKRIIEIDLEPANNNFEVQISYQKDFSFDNTSKLTIRFDNENEATIFKYFVEKERINDWQKFFEKNIPIPEPFYYQYHFFLKKVNSRGDQDSRVIVLTNEFIFNIEYQILNDKKKEGGGNDFNLRLHKPKWALSIKSFEELQIIEKDKKKKTSYFMIKIKINQKENKTYVNEKKLPYKSKSSTEFIFQNEKTCRFFVFQIKRLYYDLNDKKYIKVTES